MELVVYGTEWQISDTDYDGMPDGWEVEYGLDPTTDDASEDEDGDGFSNLIEYQRGTDASVLLPQMLEKLSVHDISSVCADPLTVH